ncbi:hypothetical protein [Methanoculleus sp.]|uniref:hypothetical protein n=1 Tax=Methanoculleus sp. TaxID=90427 RepID=UPI001BD2F91C|nr:hypothetical protein [Methanoculleus sp.]
MREHAVTTVVAALLILAVVVTFLSIYSTMILPSLKAQSDADHIHNVEETFCEFRTDMEDMISSKREITLSESVPLGGGEIIMEPLRSAGTLQVQQEDEWIFNITCNGSTRSSRLVNVSYTPVSNFWQNQGYSWQYGYLNVTKGGITTPLDYLSMEEVNRSTALSGLAASFIDITGQGCPVYLFNTTTSVPEPRLFNCTTLTLSIVTMKPGEQSFATGNGIGTLSITGNVTEYQQRAENITIRVNNDRPHPWNTTILEKCNSTLSQMSVTYDNLAGVNVTSYAGYDDLKLSFTDEATAPDVAIRVVELTVSAY